MLGSLPLQMVPIFEIYEKTKLFEYLPLNSEVKRLTFRTISVILISIAAMVVPKFGLFINLTGACACTALAFLFPIKMFSIVNKEITRFWKLIHYVILIMGIFAGSISFLVSSVALVNAFSEPDELQEEFDSLKVQHFTSGNITVS
jgi:hypothetical protein